LKYSIHSGLKSQEQLGAFQENGLNLQNGVDYDEMQVDLAQEMVLEKYRTHFQTETTAEGKQKPSHQRTKSKVRDMSKEGK
jgi:hypothetical protein